SFDIRFFIGKQVMHNDQQFMSKSYNTLRMSGIRTVEQFRKMTIEELGKIENMKREYIEEIARSIIRLV
ncbi:DNA-directed RNA polymerase subunit alpha C-terminal domain-containing protein, partial [Rhizobium ruizarguesonis]